MFFAIKKAITETSMEQFQNLNQSALVDKVAEYTAKYSKLKAEGAQKRN
jgi:hypothetical protein